MDERAREGAVGIVDPRTGLASDYTNHLAGVAMLIELLPTMPELGDDVLAWQRLSYEEYFQRSPLSKASDALAAWAEVSAETRHALEEIVAAHEHGVRQVQSALQNGTNKDAASAAAQVAPDLAKLLARLADLVNGSQTDAAAA